MKMYKIVAFVRAEDEDKQIFFKTKKEAEAEKEELEFLNGDDCRYEIEEVEVK
jgi:hypothetical protein